VVGDEQDGLGGPRGEAVGVVAQADSCPCSAWR
jgi:hypothetical protein